MKKITQFLFEKISAELSTRKLRAAAHSSFLKRGARKNVLLSARFITLLVVVLASRIAPEAQTRAKLRQSSPPALVASYKVVDIMPKFWQFWEQSQNRDMETKIRLFRELILQPNEKVYKGFSGVFKADGTINDEAIVGFLDKVPQYIPAMRHFYSQLQTELPHYGRRFKKKFPDVNGNTATIYFMVNLLGGWDAGSGELGNQEALIFNVDSIVQLHGEKFNPGPMFHHELFHIYHAQLHPEWKGKNRAKGEIPFYWLLWTEGLATYVSRELNPRAKEEDISLSKPLVAETRRLMPKLAKEVRGQLDSGDAYINFLSGRP